MQMRIQREPVKVAGRIKAQRCRALEIRETDYWVARRIICVRRGSVTSARFSTQETYLSCPLSNLLRLDAAHLRPTSSQEFRNPW